MASNHGAKSSHVQYPKLDRVGKFANLRKIDQEQVTYTR